MIERKINLRRVKAERIANGYSHDDMAKALGYKDRGAYARREQGLTEITLSDFLKMVEMFGFGLGDIEFFLTQSSQKSDTK
ncbi:MAG: helix-turn-helix domain-containing protein [Culicoidibacterales bacterium]